VLRGLERGRLYSSKGCNLLGEERIPLPMVVGSFPLFLYRTHWGKVFYFRRLNVSLQVQNHPVVFSNATVHILLFFLVPTPFVNWFLSNPFKREKVWLPPSRAPNFRYFISFLRLIRNHLDSRWFASESIHSSNIRNFIWWLYDAPIISSYTTGWSVLLLFINEGTGHPYPTITWSHLSFL